MISDAVYETAIAERDAAREALAEAEAEIERLKSRVTGNCYYANGAWWPIEEEA